MSDIKITDYKGHEISYSENEDKFICEIELNEDFRKMKRVSLKAIKDEIDQFIKINIGFVPFNIISVGHGNEMLNKKVTAIRKDGTYVVEGRWGNSYESKKDFIKYRKFNSDFLDKYNDLEKEKNEVIARIRDEQKILIELLEPLDLSLYFPE